MIHWQSKPDLLFRRVLTKTFACTLDEITHSLNAFGPNENNTFFEDSIVKMFGGLEKLRDHILTLQKASKSKKMYHISSYSFLILDRMLHYFCDYHSNVILKNGEYTSAIRHRGMIVEELNAEEFIEVYFFDLDYDLDPDYYNELDEETKNELGFSEDMFGVVNRMMPHPLELEPREMEIDECGECPF